MMKRSTPRTKLAALALLLGGAVAAVTVATAPAGASTAGHAKHTESSQQISTTTNTSVHRGGQMRPDTDWWW